MMIMSSPNSRKIVPKIRKRSKIGGEKSCSILDSLPTEMIVKIIARVASSSIVDRDSCKLTCKVLDEIGEEKEVLKQVCLESFRLFQWRRTRDAMLFFKKCEESYNPEAIFHLGLVNYFTDVKLEEGMKNLEIVVGQGHKTATYALSIILLCNGEDDSKERAVMLLDRLSRAREIVECRKKLYDTMSLIWMKNRLIERNKKPKFSCPMKELHESRWCGWNERDYYNESSEEILVCKTCNVIAKLVSFLDA